MSEKLNIPILLGTNRPGNKTQHMVHFIKEVSKEFDDEIETLIVDPKDFNFPGDGNDPEGKDPKYTEITKNADAFVLVFPEYNHSFPATLKRMLDSELSNYIHKPASLVGVSSGAWGGIRAVENIVNPLRELGLVATFADVYTTKSYDRFDESGKMVMDEEMYTEGVKRMFKELIWMAKTLKYGRENIESDHHQ